MKLVKENKNIALAYNLSLLSIVFLIAILPKMVVWGFILMFLSVVFGLIKKQFSFQFNSVLLAFTLLYFIYLIGACFTHNYSAAAKYLEYKLSFILIPFLFSFRPKFEFKLSFPIIGLSLGIIAVSIWGFAKAFAVYSVTHYALTAFTASNICVDHPTYFAAFTLVSVAGIWYLHKIKSRGFTGKWIFLYLIFAVIMLFLSYAMAAILFFLLIVSFMILRWIYFKINRWLAISMLLFLPFLMFFTITNIPAFKDEINNSMVAFKSYIENPSEFIHREEGVASGDKVRLIMWTVTAKAWWKYPFGVGTGNVDEYLSLELKAAGQKELAQKDEKNEILYNPHNQFLQTGLEVGAFGFFALLFILGTSIRIGLKTQNWLLLFVISCLIFNCLFESILQRQTGIVFFTFWICILVIHSKSTFPNKLNQPNA
jgi:O-antigen ligase